MCVFKTIDLKEMIILHNIEMKSVSEVKYFFIDRSSELKDQKIVLSFQWLRLHGATAGGTDLLPCQGTEMPQEKNVQTKPFFLKFI